MTISAKMILDSVSPNRIRIRSIQLRYPKFIHGELLTHRAFSRNASSSRAIPVSRLIDDVINDTAMPLKWFDNVPGMQGGAEITGYRRQILIDEWLGSRDDAIARARKMSSTGAHKQHINRVLEPYAHINVLVTSTDWANWEALRDHKDAQPEIMELARQIKFAFEGSVPNLLRPGQWHLPYVNPADWAEVHEDDDDRDLIKTLIKISVARCARVSYLTQEGLPPKISKDLELYEKLVGSEPLHASPAEHQATPDKIIEGHEGPYGEWRDTRWERPGWHGNFNGWCQFRKMLPNERVVDAPYVCA